MQRPQPLSARDLTFSEAVGELVSASSRRGAEPPSWDRVTVFESRVGPGQDPRFVAAGPAERYEVRWLEVLDRVDRGWVNLRLLPITEGALGVLVEYVDSPAPEPRREKIALVFGGELTEA